MPDEAPAPAPVRAFWTGTISFGLVSIPVDFYAAARARQKAMKLVDLEGHPLGRQYVSSKDGRPLPKDDIVRGYQTDQGQMVIVTDQEFEAAAPETSRDIELSRFVPLDQISPWYFVRPYFLVPAMRSGKAYSLLAETMERAGKVAIGRLVMRGHEYLVAIIAEGGSLRAETLRYFDELRTPEGIGLPDPAASAKKLVKQFAGEIGRLRENRLGLEELEDKTAEALHDLAERKLRERNDVIDISVAQEEQGGREGGAEIVDLVQLLRRSLAGKTSSDGSTAGPGPGGASARQAHAAAGRKNMSRDELYKMAAELGVSGRSKMNKGQLLRAVRAAG